MERRFAGRYVVEAQIGSGGTARVYRALDERLGRHVAVKLLDAALIRSADPAGRERFLRECRTAAGFDHPGAVTVFDAGEDTGELFLVMELVEGESLAERLARDGALPLDVATEIATRVLDVLASAHADGIVHRDVKPANVLLAASGAVKLSDFGIAKRFDDLEESVTSTGMVIGTPRYLAPEQATGASVTPATDLYAAGVLLFEMLAGRPPFEGDSAIAVALAQQTSVPPDIRTIRPEVPAAVAETIARALAADPADRPVDAPAMVAELAAATAPRRSNPTAAMPVGAVAAPVTEVMPGTAGQGGAGGSSAAHTSVMRRDPSRPQEHQRVRSVSTGMVALGVAAAIVVAGFVVLAAGQRGAEELTSVAVESPSTVSETAATEIADTTVVTESPVTEPVDTQPVDTEPPPPAEPPPATAPPVAELIPGFPVTSDLATFLAQVEGDPGLVGPAGPDLADDLRELLDEDGRKQRDAARELRGEMRKWSDDGEIAPQIAAALDELLEPLAGPERRNDDDDEGGDD